MPIRVLIADDEALMRRALVMFVGAAEDLEVVGEASDGAVALRQVAALRPDVVLMDMQMPNLDGVEATEKIVTAFPDTRVVAITTFSSERYVIPALRAGASGYLVKDAEPEQIVEAVREVHSGACVISPQVTRGLVDSVREARDAQPQPLSDGEALSERELDVVVALGRGRSNAEIAQDLHLSEATVKTHLGKVMTKWAVRDRVQVVIKAARTGLIRIGEQ
ncbi:response regulator [Microbacterium sp.]|uniref:response regulator n=1 Tax=Microbacterium sp. TaxID=51671 RepID=UPI003A84C4E4